MGHSLVPAALATAGVIAVAFYNFYRMFVAMQRSMQRQHLRMVRADREALRFLERNFGYRSETAADLLRAVIRDRLRLLRLYRNRSLRYMLLGIPHTRQRLGERMLDVSYDLYSEARSRLLSEPMGTWEDDDDEED